MQQKLRHVQQRDWMKERNNKTGKNKNTYNINYMHGVDIFQYFSKSMLMYFCQISGLYFYISPKFMQMGHVDIYILPELNDNMYVYTGGSVDIYI